MKGKDESIVVDGIQQIKIDDKNIKDNCQFFSEVQCAGDSEIDAGFQFSTAVANKITMPTTDEQSKPLDKLKDIFKEANQVKKLMFLPPHGEWIPLHSVTDHQ